MVFIVATIQIVKYFMQWILFFRDVACIPIVTNCILLNSLKVAILTSHYPKKSIVTSEINVTCIAETVSN